MSLEKYFRISDLFWLAYRLPRKLYFFLVPIHALMRLATFQGRLRWKRARNRDLVLRNLSSAFQGSWSHGEIRLIARRHFEYLQKRKRQLRFPLSRGFAVKQRWPVENLGRLDQALALGHGVILAFTHFGYYRLIRHVLRLHGYSVIMVGAGGTTHVREEKARARRMEQWSVFRRYLASRLEVNLARQRDLVAGLNVRPLLRALKEKKILMLAADSDHSVSFLEFPLVGYPFSYPTGLVKVAMANGTPVLPVFAVDGDGYCGVDVIISEPLAMDQASDPVHAGLEHFARIYDSYARKWPHLSPVWSQEGGPARWRDRTKKELSERLADFHGVVS